jgi:hypothetical protein
MKYGIYDTKDNCWLGDENGLKLFEEPINGVGPETLAQISAQLAAEQVGYPMGRLQARLFEHGEMTLRDRIDTKMTPEEALIRLEGGK